MDNCRVVRTLKTTYSLMVWDFKETGKPCITPMEELPANTVKIRQNEIATTMKQAAENKAIRNLGVNQALTLQEKTEPANLKTKAHKFAYAVSVCRLRQDKIWKG
eukprot:12809870-Ditylum_brightwellii.AAC.1